MPTHRSRFAEGHRGVLIFEVWEEFYTVEGKPVIMEKRYQLEGKEIPFRTIEDAREYVDRKLRADDAE